MTGNAITSLMPKPNSVVAARARGRAGQLRIIAGQWRGRRLPVPDVPGLRPTPDRVRETLFNWLAPQVRDARCLDLFCGTGALGLEALSRGAQYCEFVEVNRTAARQLSANLVKLQAVDRATVHCADVLTVLARPPVQPVDLVFVDPPFRQQWLDRCLEILDGSWLAPDAWVYVESAVDENLLAVPRRWQLHREKTAGQVCYRLFRCSPSQPPLLELERPEG